MSSTAAQQTQERKPVTIDKIIGWAITIGIIFLGGYVTLKTNEAMINTKLENLERQSNTRNEYYEKRFDKQDEKLDKIIDGIHAIDLQLKDKLDRPNPSAPK